MQPEHDGPLLSVTVQREFDASPESVFDAWIEQDTARQWLFGSRTAEMQCEIDPRVGKPYRITRIEGGEQYVAVGQYLEVERPVRLVFTFGMPQFAPDICTVTVDIRQDGDRTVLELEQDGLGPDYVEPTRIGWEAMFDLLAETLAKSKAA